MSFSSILFEKSEDAPEPEPAEAPDFFVDLNLNQILAAVTAGKQEYNLEPYFYAPLRRAGAIRYRQAIMRDIAGRPLLMAVNAFAEKMRLMRRYLNLIRKLHYPDNKRGWHLEAVDTYCDAICRLVEDLREAEIQSGGLRAFRDYLQTYAGSASFTDLLAETTKLKTDLAAIRYCVVIKGDTIKVRTYEDEPDYSVEVEADFEKFKQGAVRDYRVKLAVGSGMNHIEAKILSLVAKLFPETFAELDDYCARHSEFLDPTIGVFDREIQFYVAYLEHIASIETTGLSFCYPQLAEEDKAIHSITGFDLALAAKRVGENAPVVTNDFSLAGAERVIIVSGPNQGGKTTFARAFGQLHYLACLGCPVPGREARLFLFDCLFTHFEREENIQNLRGKLQDDLVRIHDIMDQATPRSLVVLNEIFSSTTLQDAVFLSEEILTRILDLDLLGVWVSFVDELASFSEKTVSMVSTVEPENPAVRTYKIIRRPADGLAYALSIAEKYRLTYGSILERIPS